jgi:hypothetical protein
MAKLRAVGWLEADAAEDHQYGFAGILAFVGRA